MSEQEAKVRFGEVGSQQVVSAFNSVGTAAGKASGEATKASSAFSQVGSGMKNTVSSIGQVTTAFATLALSIVNTWRAYRDLSDAQIAVDKANLRVKKTTEAIRKSEAEIAQLKKESAKGGLEQVAAGHKIQLMEQKLAKDRKEGKKTALELRVQEDAILLARKEGTPASKKLMDAENKLALQKEQLGVQTDVAGEAQERFNDIQQNFYLSLAPLVLSSIGTLTTAFSGFKNIFTGGGGLLGGLGPIALILTGISLAIVAFQTNFLGLRDAIGGVIDWLKERFGVWKDTIEAVFNLIKGGDWGKAFDLIRVAAVKFWEDLKKSVPFFGGVENLINLIRQGKWGDAFNAIRDAAVFFWVELKKAIPLFGTIETVINQIKNGKWEDAFTTIGDAIKKGLAAIFGGDIAEKIVLKFQLMKDSAIAEMNLMRDGIKPALTEIQAGLAKLGQGDFIGGFQEIWKGLDMAIGIFITRVNDWIKLNFGIDLVSLAQQANAIGVKILDGIKAGLTFVARTWIDPILVKLLDPVTWIQGFIALGGFFVKIGTALYTAIGTALGNAAKDPKGTATWWGQIGDGIWKGITDWFATNLPGAKKALEAMAQSFVDAFESTKVWFTNIGIGIWNNIIDGLKSAVPVDFNDAVKGWLESLKRKPIEVPAKVVIKGDASTQLGGPGGIPVFKAELQPKIDQPKLQAEANNIISKIKPPQLKLDADAKQADQKAGQFKNRVERGKYIAKIDADNKEAEAKRKAMQAAINNTKASIKVSIQQQNITDRFAKMAGLTAQGGLHQTLSRDTLIQAHKGEQVDIDKPAKQAGNVGGKGSGINVRVFIGDTELKQLIHYTVSEDQGISK